MSKPKRVVTSAFVTVKVRVDVGDTWGPECALDQVHKQAKESAIGKIRRACEKSDTHGIHLVSEPIVTAVMAETANG
jgi:hypothetical protein